MKIEFKKVVIHHFLSFGDAEISLKDAGYVLVSGINNNPKDAAKNNGSGKSAIWSAICYALTGETIQGLKSNLSNIYTNDGCYVTLYFKVDKDEYVLTRSKDDSKLGTNLKIYINGEDKSGKGIRESQALLDQYLPDITSELIGSVIILGQGLPHKFSNNTPSGRKEMLEKLSRSDFMIQDIKERLTKRSDTLSKDLRTTEDILLESTTQVGMYNNQKANAQKNLASLGAIDIYESTISQARLELNRIEKVLEDDKNTLSINSEQLAEENAKLLGISENRNSVLGVSNSNYLKLTEQLINKKFELQNKLAVLSKEIITLKSISDTCPVCKQKLQGVEKPDTTQQEEKAAVLQKEVNSIIADINTKVEQHTEYLRQECLEYNQKTKDITEHISQLKSTISEINSRIASNTVAYNKYYKDLANAILVRDNYIATKASFEKAIIDADNQIMELQGKIFNLQETKTKILEHIEVINKMNTLIKRDFRGFLLTNVIDFINAKAKSYCSYVFDSSDIEFTLNGNNIEISYCNKSYENLSGGEKQKIDLIIQFSIRDMLCQYLEFSSNLLALDEIFDNLDSVGCSKILNLISEKLIDIESIFIITHHQDDLAVPYDFELRVEKNAEGMSRII